MPPVVELFLAEPPEVVTVGRNVHGRRARSEVFRLPDLWQFHLYGYSADLTFLGGTFGVRPRSVSLVPPGTEVRFDYRGRSEHLFAHFRTTGRGTPVSVPAVQDAGDAAPIVSSLLQHAAEAFPSGSPQVSAEVWTALWRVAGLAGPAEADGRHEAVVKTLAHIEATLAQPPAVPELARLAGVSHNHLTRLFRAETGDTVVAYIRRRRMARVQHLLTSSTLSIAAVAASVGITDLQAFNKLCHRELGGSPRAIRAG